MGEMFFVLEYMLSKSLFLFSSRFILGFPDKNRWAVLIMIHNDALLEVPKRKPGTDKDLVGFSFGKSAKMN